MNVLFQIRKNYSRNIAGDSIVAINLMKNLMKIGVEVTICSDHNMDLTKYDIVHIFNTVRVEESYKFMLNAKKHSKKIVLTSIYWDLKKYFEDTNQVEKIESWNRSEKKRKYLFDHCHIYLPHCKKEAELIYENYKATSKYEIIPYGVDESFSMGKNHYLKDKYGIDDYILCVGRINKQKNQLGLIRGFSNEKIPLVLVGPVNDKDYLKACMRQGKKKVIVLDNINQVELKSIYKNANVHVLPSWVEYPGLASLEAGIAGCNVVTTEIGSTKEVFKEFVRYCNPHSEKSIYEETMTAFETCRNDTLKNFIKENYTWMKSAKKLKDIYLSMN